MVHSKAVLGRVRSRLFPAGFLVGGLFCATGFTSGRAFGQPDTAAAPLPANSLISNGDLETPSGDGKSAKGWENLPAGITWEQEGDNHFIRLTSTTPGSTVLLYRLYGIPDGISALQLTWKQRITNLTPGGQPWFDARIMMNFKDGINGHQVNPSPGAPYSRGNTDGWVTRTQTFLVPQGAHWLEFMPTLFQVKSGTFDLDDISLTPVDAAPIQAQAAADAVQRAFLNLAPELAQPAKWPSPLHIVGNQVLNQVGQPVWLQGVCIDSLEWNDRGENILRSTEVATDVWKSNIIRLPVKPDFWFGREDGQTDAGAGYRTLIDNAVTMAANRGAYVLLDLHGFGAPHNSDLEFWKDAGAHFANNPAVLFDLFNEPHNISWDVWQNGGFVEDKNAPADEDNFLSAEEKAKATKGFHTPGMQALIDAVRAAGAKNVVLVGGLDWSYDLTGIANGHALHDPNGNGIMYAAHIYPWKTGWADHVLLIADKYPILVGEVGADAVKMTWLPAEQQEDASTWVPKILGLIQKYKLNWTAFSFHPSASPRLLTGWDYTPTPFWGVYAKEAIGGQQFPFVAMK